MELWTEYEGRTIDGAFPLRKLLLPEGRSAFFSTSNTKGEPTVIRLIASHFDEEEILARWRGVKALGHPNILKLEQFGQLELDDTTVVYAVMEPVDANLAEVIRGQRLSLPEVHQLASSLAAALDVLHTNGFVHEHVEPGNIYAVGEIVKLRGDCIRETPEGDAGIEGRKHDIHNLGIVLLQAFGQQPPFEASSPRSPLPVPFDQVIPNAIRGSWTLDEIRSAIGPDPSLRSISSNPADHSAIPASTLQATTAAAPAAQSAPGPASSVRSVAAATSNPSTNQPPESEVSNSRAGNFTPPTVRSRFDSSNGLPRTKTRKIWAAVAVAALLILWLFWHSVHGTPKSPITNLQTDNLGANSTTQAVHTPVSAKPSPAAGRVNQRIAASAGSNLHEQWRVVAFTYNFRDQAQKKATTVAQKHPDLHVEVFTPTGRAPFLVTVGGPMSRDTAYAFVHKSSRWGLPRDTYAQNYSGKQR